MDEKKKIIIGESATKTSEGEPNGTLIEVILLKYKGGLYNG